MPRGGGAACTNAHARPPELEECISATTNRAPDAEIAAPRRPGAGDWLPTSNTNPDMSEPVKIYPSATGTRPIRTLKICCGKRAWTSGRSHASYPSCGSTLARSLDRDIKLDEGAYRLLTNMLVHLIEESSKDRGLRRRARRGAILRPPNAARGGAAR